ncbi:unnamed protein product, partial [Allacma fusca]
MRSQLSVTTHLCSHVSPTWNSYLLERPDTTPYKVIVPEM